MSVKVFRSDQFDAPIINGVSGTLIAALDAILVNGYGQVSVSAITLSGTTATVSTAAPHGLRSGDVALIAGAVEPEYNGEHQVTVLDSTTYTIAIAGSPSSPATGTITAKRAPGGFSKVFAGTNKAVYRSNDISSRRHFFRVVDAGATSGGPREAQIWGYEEMTDVDSGSGMFPTSGQHQYGYFWQKSDTADSTGRHWVLVTDGKTFYHFAYIMSQVNTTYAYNSLTSVGTNMSAVGFGDLISFREGDAHASFITGHSTPNQFSSTQYCGLFHQSETIDAPASVSTSQPCIILARDFTGVEGGKIARLFATGLSSTIGQTVYLAYPHLIDNGFYMAPTIVVQGAPSLIRGRVPGFYEPMHSVCLPNTTIIENVQGYVGRKFMMLYGKHGSGSAACLIDITGPWDS